MAFNGSGVFNRIHSWITDLAGAVPVTASRMDAEMDGMATGLSTCIARDGQSTTTARIPFASGTSAAAGTTASVSYAQTNDTNTGMYFPATDQWGLVAGGTAVLTGTASGVAVTGTLTTSGALTPLASDGAALGSASVMWADLFVALGAVINFNNGDVTVTHAANTLTFGGASSGYAFTGGPVVPATNDAAALGTTALMWSDLFLASGAVINFNNGDVTVTHSANQIAVAGGTLACEALSPSGNVAVATNKFTVAAASGDTAVAGALAVTGASTLTGALTANNSAGVTARNTAKAFVAFTTDGSSVVTITGSYNVTSVATATVNIQNGFRVTFTSALPSNNYAVVHTAGMETSSVQIVAVTSRDADRATTTYDFVALNASTGVVTANINCSLVFFDNG